MNVYIWTSGVLKNAYIGEVVYCDFTQGDCWFTFSKKTWAINSYWRNSNWFYWINSSSYNQAISWKPPQSLYTKWPIKKIEIQAKTTTAWWWCWISYNLDTYFCRVWWQWNMKKWTWTDTVETLTSEPPANTTFTFTVDFVNKIQIYSIEPSKTIVLTDAEITTIQNYWSNGTLDICAMLRNISWTTTYIQNATFYF